MPSGHIAGSMTHRLKYCISALALVASLPVTAAPASADRFEARYTISLYGLPVARASFASAFDGDNYRVDGSLASSGIARVLDRTQGTTRVQGVIGDNGAVPRSFEVQYTSGRESKRRAISFSNGRVHNTVVTPEPRNRPSTWVNVRDEHLRSVFDPISSTLVKADNARAVCDRTISLFDGEIRFDLQMSLARTGSIRNFPGEGVTCNARFVPVSGYRQGRSQIEYLKNRSSISLSFVPLGQTGLYTVSDVSVGTQIGTIHMRADSIRVM